MEAVSLTSDIQSEKSWSLALTDDSLPDDANVFLLNTLESNVLIPNQYSAYTRARNTLPPNLYLVIIMCSITGQC